MSMRVISMELVSDSQLLPQTLHTPNNLQNGISWKILSLWRGHGHSCKFIIDKTFRHRVLMWDVSYDNIQGGEDEEEQEGKKGRQIEWRQGTQFWAAVPLGLERRDWKPLYLPAYEINMTLHSQASCLTSSQPYSGSKESIKTTLGHLCWGCFGMRDVQLCLSELLAGVQGVMKSLVSARLAQMQPLAPLDQWGSPRLWSAPSPSAPKCRESICVPAWVAPLHTNSWPSQICDEQKCSMERQAETGMLALGTSKAPA